MPSVSKKTLYLLMLTSLACASAHAQVDSHFDQGMKDLKRHDWAKAVEDFTASIRLLPAVSISYENRGSAYLHLGQFDKAIADYDEALFLNNDEILSHLESLHYNRGIACFSAGKYDNGVEDFSYAISETGGFFEGYIGRGYCQTKLHHFKEAHHDFEQAQKFQSKRHKADVLLINLCLFIGDVREASDRLTRLRKKTGPAQLTPPENNMIAWLLATAPVDGFRNGASAVEFATQACSMTNWNLPNYVDTLAASYAEQGDFANAVKTEEKYLRAASLSEENRRTGEARLALYRQSRPSREPVVMEFL